MTLADLLNIFIGIAISAIIYFLQEKSPDITVFCELFSDLNPGKIRCIIKNTGRSDAKDVYIGFNQALLIGIEIIATPEQGLGMIESNPFPNLDLFPSAAEYQKAFSVHIPHVPKKDECAFSLMLLDEDNQKAAHQRLRIANYEKKILGKYLRCFEKIQPEITSSIDMETLEKSHYKKLNFFKPGYFSYEKGKIRIRYYTEDEEFSQKAFSDLYRTYKKKCVSEINSKESFKAPVVKVKSNNGQSTMAFFPPYVKTYTDLPVNLNKLRRNGSSYIKIPIPKSYD